MEKESDCLAPDVLLAAVNILQLIGALNMDPQVVFATIRFLQKFYSKNKDFNGDFFIPSMSSFHLSSKVNECAVSITQIKNAVEKVKEDPTFKIYFQNLTSKTYEEEVNGEFGKNIEKTEMEIITTLNFDFTIINPLDLAFSYVLRTLSWHFDLQQREIEFFIENDCIKHLKIMLLDLLFYSSMYTVQDKAISLVLARLVMEHFKMPIPKLARTWNTILEPSIEDKEFDKVYLDFKKFITFSVSFDTSQSS